MEENNKLPYLTEEEIKVCIDLIYGIDDAMNSIRTEIFNNSKAYKHYLKEKLSIINTNLRCFNNIIDKEN